jgi:hypothetical protein
LAIAIAKQVTIAIYIDGKNNINEINMSFCLKLELKSDKKVLVTNSETNQKIEVTLGFLQGLTGDAFLLLVQYKYYELYYNAERVWQRVEHFNPDREAIIEIQIQQEFVRIMNNDAWMKITDYDREMYNKALIWVNNFAPKNSIDRTALIAAGTGAVVGASTSSLVGGMGVTVGGTAFGVGMLGLATVGTIAGLAVYGMTKAFT